MEIILYGIESTLFSYSSRFKKYISWCKYFVTMISYCIIIISIPNIFWTTYKFPCKTTPWAIDTYNLGLIFLFILYSPFYRKSVFPTMSLYLTTIMFGLSVILTSCLRGFDIFDVVTLHELIFIMIKTFCYSYYTY